MTMTLFAVCLGGRAPKGHTELHDTVFVVGEDITATYDQLLSQWFGQPQRLHIDSWIAVTHADGYRVSLSEAVPTEDQKLFFVNLGAYADGCFAEIHASGFFVAASADAAKARAKEQLFQNWPSDVHTDDVLDVKTCLALPDVHIVLTPETGHHAAPRPVNGYHPLPKDVVDAFVHRS
ncbi:MAG: DUF1543 domain-containing protein [Rhodospirillaceae bacterium]|nr:DUF1543 domain-containing protein [Rhodospirillaceae bacterium]